jgi:GGDEF domain-containing protein
MKSVRRSFIFLIIGLALFFNIERLDINGRDTIDLESFIYPIGGLAAILPLLPVLQRRPVYFSAIPVLAFAVIGKAISPRPDFGDAYTYITIVEMLMVTVIVILAHRVGSALEEFYRAVELVTLSDKNGRLLHTMHEANDLVQIEMSSSRRTQRPLSLVLLQADAGSLNMKMHRFVQEVQRGMMQRYVLSIVARLMSRSLRRTDIVIEDTKPGRLVLIAPETPEEAASTLAWRLTDMVQERLGITTNFSVATFPQQALTFEELLEVAEKQLHERAPGGGARRDLEHEVMALAEQRAGTRSGT